MNAEFNVWLLVVGLVVGAGLMWYVLMDTRRREADITARERPLEAAWLSATIRTEGWDVPPEAAERLLELHGVYVEAPPPDRPDPAVEIDVAADGPAGRPGSTGSEGPEQDRVRLDA